MSTCLQISQNSLVRILISLFLEKFKKNFGLKKVANGQKRQKVGTKESFVNPVTFPLDFISEIFSGL
jgi:hypothetical protein